MCIRDSSHPQGAEGPGYYRVGDARDESRALLREAAAAGAEFVRCPEHVGDVPGYVFADGGAEGTGYYRQHDAPPPDPYEYMSLVLGRASAAAAAFIACPNYVRELDGYRYADGPDGRGYYRQKPEEPKQDDYDELMRMAMGT